MKREDFRADLLPTIERLEIHAKRSVLSTILTGNWISKVRGHGIEFGGYRMYSPGDDANMIDWKASVRAKKLLVKEIDEEKNLNIYLLVDTSDTMLFGTTDKLKAEYVAELVSSLSFAALKSGEGVSLSVFSDKLHRYVPVKQGGGHHATLMKVLADLQFYGGARNLSHSGSQLISTMMVPGLVIIVSDFIGLSEADDRILKIIAEKYDLIGIMVRDPRDRELPAEGQYALSDPSNGQVLIIDVQDYAAPYKEYVLREEEKLRNLFRKAGADLLCLSTTDDYSRKITQFIVKHNQRRER
jgi:uncharacterized protein (DUF58 family)